jgi:hypothetical protein
MGRGRIVVLLGVAAICGVAACSNETGNAPPLGHGDTVFLDVEASTLPPQPSSDANLDPDGIFDKVDGSNIYGERYDAYAQLTVCSPPDGSDAAASDGGARDAGSAGKGAGEPDGAALAYPADGGAASGCVPFPATCASEPDCQCLFAAFKAQIPCPYPSCGVQKHGFSIYCPP